MKKPFPTTLAKVVRCEHTTRARQRPAAKALTEQGGETVQARL